MKNKSIRISALVFFILVIANLISARYFLRLDFTADKSYTLSQATKNIITTLPKTVTVTAYFTKDLPPDISNIRNDFRDLLVEYYHRSHGKVVFEFVDPSASPLDEEAATRSGIQPLVVNVREKDQMKQQKIYLGALIKSGDQNDVIPFIKPGASMEFALTSSIRKITMVNKPVVGFLQGHGEPPLASFQQLMAALQVQYEVEPLSLSDSSGILPAYKTVVVDAPRDPISERQTAYLEQYLNQGGNLVLALNKVDGNFQTLEGEAKSTGVEKWLESKGVTLKDNFVVDASCATIGLQQQQGGIMFTTQVPFPYFPLITNFEKHPVTSGLESVILQFASPIMWNKKQGIEFHPLAFTSNKSNIIKSPVKFDVNKEWKEEEFNGSPACVAAALEGKTSDGKSWRMVLITDGDFANNGMGQQAQEVQPDNINLLANAIDWLTDQSGIMEIRSKEVTSRPLAQLDDGRKNFIKWINFLLPILLVIGYGIFRMQQNRAIRVHRMQPGTI